MSRFEEKQLGPVPLSLISFVSGITLSFAFPQHDLFFLAWFGMVPFLWGLTLCTEKDAFGAGIVFGISFFFGTQYWISHSIHHYGNLNYVLSVLIVGLLSLYESLYTALFAFLTNQVARKTRLPLVFFAPALWVCLEFARGYLITGFPWSFVAHSQYRMIPLIQIADITGAYGISFLVVAANSIIVDFFVMNRRRRKIPLYPAIPTYFGAFLLFIVLVGSLAYGFHRTQEKPSGAKIKVAIIQGNIEQDKKWDPLYQSSVLSTYLSLTKERTGERPDLIVWPETAVPFFFNTDREFTSKLIAFQEENQIPLFFGSVMVKSLTSGKYRLTNSAILLDRNGNTAYTYDKIHLVPFGEYVPLRSVFFFVDKLVEGVGDYIPGNDYRSAHAPFGQFATAICYELIFPSLIRNYFMTGGDFLITITNDAWFGKTSGPYQHFTAGVFRAIENRKPVIRAANTGVSGFIDSHGRIIKKTDLFKQQVVSAAVVENPKITFYTKYGDIFIYLCLLLVAIILVNMMFHSKPHFGGKRW
ncbi:MAG: apolipoprotein N-acyltransferase [bacterium]